MKRELVEEYRAKARAERTSAATLNAQAAQVALNLAASYDRVADAYESLIRTVQDNELQFPRNGSSAA